MEASLTAHQVLALRVLTMLGRGGVAIFLLRVKLKLHRMRSQKIVHAERSLYHVAPFVWIRKHMLQLVVGVLLRRLVQQEGTNLAARNRLM